MIFKDTYLVEGQICNKTFFERIDLNIKIPSKGESVLENKNIEKLSKVNDLYKLKVGDMCVEMAYKDNRKSFSECMVNILKQKVKKG